MIFSSAFFLFISCSSVLGHVALTFPPARRYAFDYIDSYSYYGRDPCGIPKTAGAPATTLVGGSTILVTWHLSFPHYGGSKLELIQEIEGQPYRTIASLTAGDQFHFKNDTTKQSAFVTLPDIDCEDCAIRLIRQGAEYGSGYLFWSCADVTLISSAESSRITCYTRSYLTNLLNQIASLNVGPERKSSLIQVIQTLENTSLCSNCFYGQCMNGGSCNEDNGECLCNRLFSGDRCQYRDECWTDEDCNFHGQCIDTRATSYPKLKCYCEVGWFGPDCGKISEITELRNDYATNPHYMQRVFRRNDVTMYWTYVKNFTEIEIVMQVRTRSWVGVGWKPVNLDGSCKSYDNVLEVEEKLDAEQKVLLQKQLNYTTTQRSPHPDPEEDIEQGLPSAIENMCSSRGKRSIRVKRQVLYRGMDCSDINVGSVKGNLYRVDDLWTPDYSTPFPDRQFGGTDDITSAFGVQEGEFTTIAFRKRINNNHFTDHSPDRQELLVIWARGQDINRNTRPGAGLSRCSASDPRFYRHDELKYHGGSFSQKGSARMILTRPNVLPDATEDNSVVAPTTTSAETFSSTSSGVCASGNVKQPENCNDDDNSFDCVMSLKWMVDDGRITFTMKGVANDRDNYLAIGFSNNVFMPMTDVYLGFITGNGQVSVTNRYASSRSIPSVDNQQNLRDIQGLFINNALTISFSRLLNSSQTNDVILSPTDCWYLLYAKGSVTNNQPMYHGVSRGLFRTTRVCIPDCN